jgi:hypothetical protein
MPIHINDVDALSTKINNPVTLAEPMEALFEFITDLKAEKQVHKNQIPANKNKSFNG